MSNPKLYACPYCGTMLQHKDVHNHMQQTCPRRKKR